MRLAVAVHDLLIATWPVERGAAERVLPPGLAAVPLDGEYRVSVVALRHTRVRLGGLPLPPFAQLNVRTYVEWEDEPAVFFLSARVSAFGLGGIALGAPYRYAVLRLGRGRLRAPGLGLALDYDVDGPGDPGVLGRHELGLFEHDGLRGIRIRRGPADWCAAQALGDPRTDLLVAYGLEATGPPALVYAPAASFEVDVPPQRLAAKRARR